MKNKGGGAFFGEMKGVRPQTEDAGTPPFSEEQWDFYHEKVALAKKNALRISGACF